MSRPMRRRYGSGSVSRRADGRWRLVTPRRFGERRQFTGPREWTKSRAESELDRILAAGVPSLTALSDLGTFLRSWLEEKRPVLRASTFSRYEGIVRVQLIPGLGKYRLAELTPSLISAYLRSLRLDPQTVKHVRDVLRNALNMAMRWRLLDHNPAALATAPRVERRQTAALSPEQVKRLLEVTGGRLHIEVEGRGCRHPLAHAGGERAGPSTERGAGAPWADPGADGSEPRMWGLPIEKSDILGIRVTASTPSSTSPPRRA